MVYHMKKTSRHMALDMKGFNGTDKIGNPPQQPVVYTKASPKVYRGLPEPVRADAGPNQSYGRHTYTGPSSMTDVKASSKLSDFDISPPDDSELDALVRDGVKDDGSSADQTRPVSSTPLPTTFGHKNPNKANEKI